MGRKKFAENRRFVYQGRSWIIRKALINKRFDLEDINSGECDIKDLTELQTAYVAEELVFETDGPNAISVEPNQIATRYSFADFQSLPVDYQIIAWYRYCIIYLLINRSRKEQSRNSIHNFLATFKPELLPKFLFDGIDTAVYKEVFTKPLPSHYSVKNWLDGFINSGNDIRSLVPDYKNRGDPEGLRIDIEAENEITKVLDECAKEDHVHTRVEIYNTILYNIESLNKPRRDSLHIPIPSKPTIFRRINNHPLKNIILGRKLSKIEEEALKSALQGPVATRILERVEIDNTPIDLIVVDDEDRLPIGRPNLTAAIDVYSRQILGFYLSFENNSYLTAMQCLKHAILPKPNVQSLYGTKHPWIAYGLPEVLIVDNGKEFIGKDLKDACGQLGIVLEQVPVHAAWFKGKIERFFRTLETELIHLLPGTTFSNIVEKGDYDSLKHSCISISSLLIILYFYLLDDYSQDVHEGIEAIPAQKWIESENEGWVPELPDNISDLNTMLSRTNYRVIQRRGIEFETLWYNSDELALVRENARQLDAEDSMSVKIKWDPSDLGQIQILDRTGDFEQWVTVPAEDQEYAKGLTIYLHRLARSKVLAEKGKVDRASIAEAKAYIKQIALDEYKTTKSVRGRKELARILGIKPTNQKPFPPASEQAATDENDSEEAVFEENDLSEKDVEKVAAIPVPVPDTSRQRTRYHVPKPPR